jgi:hypothetical protein
MDECFLGDRSGASHMFQTEAVREVGERNQVEGSNEPQASTDLVAEGRGIVSYANCGNKCEQASKKNLDSCVLFLIGCIWRVCVPWGSTWKSQEG